MLPKSFDAWEAKMDKPKGLAWRPCQRCNSRRADVLETKDGDIVCSGCYDVRVDATDSLLGDLGDYSC